MMENTTQNKSKPIWSYMQRRRAWYWDTRKEWGRNISPCLEGTLQLLCNGHSSWEQHFIHVVQNAKSHASCSASGSLSYLTFQLSSFKSFSVMREKKKRAPLQISVTVFWLLCFRLRHPVQTFVLLPDVKVCFITNTGWVWWYVCVWNVASVCVCPHSLVISGSGFSVCYGHSLAFTHVFFVFPHFASYSPATHSPPAMWWVKDEATCWTVWKSKRDTLTF